jgi:hypothetical protein
MRLKEAARLLGATSDWLKRLERRGQIPTLPRDVNGHRRLTDADVDRLRTLLFKSPGTASLGTVSAKQHRVNQPTDQRDSDTSAVSKRALALQ